MTRIVHVGLPHHLIVRGNNRRRLFSYFSDYRRFIWYVGRATLDCGCRLHALTLMSNHVHLIVTPTATLQLARFVKRFAQRYAQYRNSSRDASGKLFEQKYFSEPILDDNQLAVTTAYVELNAVRAGMVDDPFAYRWTTYSHHIGRGSPGEIPGAIWTPSEWYLGLGQSADVRAARYAAWVADCRARDTPPSRVQEIAAIEHLSDGDYRHEIVRPDRSRAHDTEVLYTPALDRLRNRR
jgi:putative transposase